jgi:hypothetical protein
MAEPRICQLDGCENTLMGKQQKYCSDSHRYAAHRDGHREERRAYNTAYRAAHLEEERIYGAAYRAAHLEQKRAYNAVYQPRYRTTLAGALSDLRNEAKRRGTW